VELDIRPATEADLEMILEIYNSAILTTTSVFSYRAHTLAMRQEWFKTRQSANYPVFVADSAGAILGFATYGPFRTWPAYKYTVEHSVYVAERARRAGIARALMQRLIAQARSQEYHAVIGGVVAENVASIRLHQSLGFVEVAHFPEVGYKFGRWLDLKFFQLLLAFPPHPEES